MLQKSCDTITLDTGMEQVDQVWGWTLTHLLFFSFYLNFIHFRFNLFHLFFNYRQKINYRQKQDDSTSQIYTVRCGVVGDVVKLTRTQGNIEIAEIIVLELSEFQQLLISRQN